MYIETESNSGALLYIKMASNPQVLGDFPFRSSLISSSDTSNFPGRSLVFLSVGLIPRCHYFTLFGCYHKQVSLLNVTLRLFISCLYKCNRLLSFVKIFLNKKTM